MHEACCSRRGLIRGALATATAAGLSGAGLSAVGLSWPEIANAASGAADSADGTIRYISRPDLRPPRVTITHRQAVPASPRYFMLTTEGPAGRHGPLIIDQNGDTVWFSPVPPSGLTKNLSVQEYQGKPVLTWWTNTRPSPDPSVGEGIGLIADYQYRVIAKIAAGDGLMADFHDLSLTNRGTALIGARRSHRVSLSKLGGSARGYVWSGVVQEVDIATGKVIFEWDSIDHVGLTETLHHFYPGTQGRPFDYFHFNSISVSHDDDLLISARNTCAVYKVNRGTGAVKWRLGGKRSSFAMGRGATFWWQHDVREVVPDVLSIFDDASQPCPEPQSRGILLDLDTARMRATLRRAYTSPARLRASNQGSMQVLSDDRVIVGWGSQPAFTEFAPDGTELLNGELPRGDWSYRAFAADWTGYPDDRPVAVARRLRSGAMVYVSWNGATDVASWTVYGGPRASALTPASPQPKTSFETAIYTRDDGPYFAVDALDADGRVLGRSATVQC
jgi:hypothetical protein